MPSQPISIAAPNASPASNVSGSPQTPYAAGSAGVGLSQSAGSSLFGKWNAFSTVKPASGNASSPPNQPNLNIPHDDFEHHDSLEFGDLGDLRARGWAAAQQQGARRAMSMSVSPTTTFSGYNPMSPSQATTLRDNLARGEGALRRLSLGGFGRPTAMPAPQAPAAVPQPPQMNSMPAPEPMLAPPTQPLEHRRVSQGRRRFSESGGRRRGVSPMGERILRDHL